MEDSVFYSIGVFIGVVCALCYKTIQHFRYADKVVNCWFCNEDSKVHYSRVNSWNCFYCEQYNGFDKDGGYNRIIPEQFSEQLNPVFSNEAEEYLSSNTTFCENCHRNQQLKIGQLAAFQPLRKENYDIEVEQFKETMEWIYRLCPDCQRKVDSELSRQNRILTDKLSRLMSYKSSESFEADKMTGQSQDIANPRESRTVTTTVSSSTKDNEIDTLDFNLSSSGSNEKSSKYSGSTKTGPSLVSLRHPLLSPANVHMESSENRKPSFDLRSETFALYTKTEKYNAYNQKEKLSMYNKWQPLKKSKCMETRSYGQQERPFAKRNWLSFARLKQFATYTETRDPISDISSMLTFNNKTGKPECIAMNGSHRQCELFTKTKEPSLTNYYSNPHVGSMGTRKPASDLSDRFTSFINTERDKHIGYIHKERLAKCMLVDPDSKSTLIHRQSLASTKTEVMQKQTGSHPQIPNFHRWRENTSDVHSY